MAEKTEDNTRRGPLRALSEWLRGAVASPTPGAVGGVQTPKGALPQRIGRYRITGKLGQGGMGVVYSARDERLERAVALKTMSALAPDETARKRFWREARAAASVNHPHVCQLYEIGEEGAELFIAMELLQGQTLADRLRGGPLSVAEALPIAFEMLEALGALHARGIVHRDLKPSNVFLTAHGVKLLDFGLARTSEADSGASLASVTELTRSGMVMGTPRYMAPEQVTGDALDARSDLFAAGTILFEMLAGRPAFTGRNAVEILNATLHEQPPALTGSPAVAAVDRIIRRALAKKPEDRHASAEAMASELRAVRALDGDDTPALARALVRLVVLPFRVLRPDPETDFLAFSLPDAIATSLKAIGPLVVRSTAVAARFGGEAPDLQALATTADVDRVVMGTLLRVGDQVRAAVQLVEVPGGALVASHTVQAPLGDLFHLQDDVARRVVEALALPLGASDFSPTPDAPHHGGAYGLYLRANELARRYEQLPQARELYLRCLDLDPRFAPAWAQLARCHRVIGKFIDGTEDTTRLTEEALRRALELSPRLTVAHKYYAQLEADTGHPRAALERLLAEAVRHGNDPELFSGLVHALRYCGLFDQAIAADGEAKRLDPNVSTSLEQTLLMTCDVDRLLAAARRSTPGGGDDVIRVIGLGLAGRREESRRALATLRLAAHLPAFRTWTESLASWLDRRPQDMLAQVAQLGSIRIMDDPEAIFQQGWLLCDAGAHDVGLAEVRRAVERGYYVLETLDAAPQFDAVRGTPAFEEVRAIAERGRREALETFRAAGGERLLGR